MSLSPLVEEQTPLLKFYVTPDIFSVEVHRARDGGGEIKTRVTPFGNMFYNDITDDLCHEIYLTADAGLGKTAFCKRLALTWCQSKNPLKNENQYFSREEIEALNKFSFVFLLLLRDSSNECDIDNLIFNKIISQLSKNYTMKSLENILTEETCLVILDGLDEWSHPLNSCKLGRSFIPHRKVREHTILLTTTRPWKLSVGGLRPSQIDQKLELTGLNQQSANKLKRSVISHLFVEENENKLDQYVDEFTRDVIKKHISYLEAVPLLLIYLLFLWYYKIELGESHCDLYCQITELLLSRTVQNFEEISPKADIPQCDIPQCFSKQTYCRQFFTLLKALGKLAYKTLYGETREENTLVFDSSVAEQYLSKDCLTLCLKTGLLTQNKARGKLFEQIPKVSFAHKTFQEFFAALYMHFSDKATVSTDLRSKCKCISDILEMSNILKFTRGINADTYSVISCELLKIINEDQMTCTYRNTLGVWVYGNPLKEFQNMCISHFQDDPHAIEEVSSCLLDVFIEKRCNENSYRENLRQMTIRNKQNIRSLYIDMEWLDRSAKEIIEYLAVNEVECVEKLHYKGEYSDQLILPLLNRSLKCLSLSCHLFEQGIWSHLLSEKMTSLQGLEATNISRFEISHSELTLLYDYISQRHCIREIALWDLLCTDHMKSSCTGCRLDLSQHTHLRKLTLSNIPLSELNIDVSSLEQCILQLSNPDLALYCLNCAPGNNKLHTFQCRSLDSPGAIDTIMDTLCSSVQVKYVELSGINIGNRALTLSPEMVHIERVELLEVTMSSSVFDDLVNVVQDLPQRVIVDISYCNLSPEIEFETVKGKIRASLHFNVLEDHGGWFQFETI